MKLYICLFKKFSSCLSLQVHVLPVLRTGKQCQENARGFKIENSAFVEDKNKNPRIFFYIKNLSPTVLRSALLAVLRLRADRAGESLKSLLWFYYRPM